MMRRIALFLAFTTMAEAFVVQQPCRLPSALRMSSNGHSNIETLEFKIFPDGRVEETVRGVKGANCETITEAINSKLGEVVASAPTEEMYEQEVKVDQTLYDSWDGSSSKSGSSW